MNIDHEISIIAFTIFSARISSCCWNEKLEDWAHFLSFTAACGGCGAFVDFFIGKAGQKNVRKVVETWWIKLAELPSKYYSRAEAEFAYNFLVRYVGKLLSLQRLKAVLFIFCACILIWIMVLSLDVPLFNPMDSSRPKYSFKYKLLFLFIHLLLLWISLSFTIFLVGKIKYIITDSALLNFFIYILFFTIQLFSIFLVPVLQVISISYGTDYFEGRLQASLFQIINFILTDINFVSRLKELLSKTAPTFGELVRYNGLLISLAPTAIRCGLMFVFLVSFMLRSFHVSILLFLQRLVESEAPIFALLGSAIGFTAKLIQVLMQ